MGPNADIQLRILYAVFFSKYTEYKRTIVIAVKKTFAAIDISQGEV